MKTICVIGLGYIGLPTASLLATKGFEVVGVDVNQHVVDTINQGKIHIVEPDLDIMVKAAVQSGRLKAATQPIEADVFIIAVPTPFKDHYKPDISYVESAVRSIAPVVRNGNLIVLESTSPVGTTEKIKEWIEESRADFKSGAQRLFYAHCPERVLPGRILDELVNNDRVVGGLDQAASRAAQEFYASFVQGQIFLTDSRTAEMTKLCENSYRDVNIAFANELSMICERLDINVWELISLANRHPRVKILQPGPGVGGHCIAVDPWFIVDSAPEEARLIRCAREVNDLKPSFVVKRVREKAAGFRHPKIACLGLSFKADVDDLRESPALHIVDELARDLNNSLFVVEPHILDLPKVLTNRENVKLTDVSSAVRSSDMIVLLVDHREFIKMDRDLLKNKVLIDTRGAWT